MDGVARQYPELCVRVRRGRPPKGGFVADEVKAVRAAAVVAAEPEVVAAVEVEKSATEAVEPEAPVERTPRASDYMNGVPAHPVLGWLKSAAYLLLLPALSAFLTMNFTGSSTYTSLSGVDREMKIAVPIMLLSAAAALLLLLASDLYLLIRGGIL